MALSSLKHWYRCKRWYEKARKTPFAHLYRQPLPSGRTPFREQRFLVIDCEMSGLDPSKHQLLSIAWVTVENGSVIYHRRRHLLVHAESGVGESIKIHGLSEKNIAGAASVTRALSLLAEQAENSVLVFHHATLDIAFLQTSAIAAFGCPLLFPYIDTMAIEQRRLTRQGKTGGLQLGLCRQRYNLPPSLEHNALTDAIATAELLLAQVAYISSIDTASLGDVQRIAIS